MMIIIDAYWERCTCRRTAESKTEVTMWRVDWLCRRSHIWPFPFPILTQTLFFVRHLVLCSATASTASVLQQAITVGMPWPRSASRFPPSESATDNHPHIWGKIVRKKQVRKPCGKIFPLDSIETRISNDVIVHIAYSTNISSTHQKSRTQMNRCTRSIIITRPCVTWNRF